MPEFLIIALVVIGSYLFGNINFALIIAKFRKVDLKKVGSGNLGTMNVTRNLGPWIGGLVLFLDALKGAIPCIIGWFFIGGIGFGEAVLSGIRLEVNPARLGAYIAGFSVISGHIFPAFLKFKGGKGIASTIGITLVLQPFVALLSFAVAFTFISLTKMGSIASFIVISVPLAVEGFSLPVFTDQYALTSAIFIFLLFALAIFAHRSNVIKLFSGTESKTGIYKKKEKSKKNKKISF